MTIRLILFLADSFLINAALLLAFVLRFRANIPESVFTPYKDSFAFITLIYLLALAFVRVFKSRFRSFWDLFKRIFSGLFLGTLFSIVLFYVFRSQWGTFPSSIFVISFPIGLFLIFTFNCLILRLSGRISKKVIVIGQNGIDLNLQKTPLVEQVHIQNIEELLQFQDIDEVVICKRIQENEQLNLLICLLLKLKVNVVFSPSVYAKLLSENIMGDNSVQFLATFVGRKSDFEEFLIRALDILGSIFMLALLSPLIGLISLLIKLTSPGSVFYKQARVAKDGKTFILYKLKTMVDDADKETEPVLAVPNDPRVTKIGKFLRATHINEIPQLLNVIRGEMSLVGPRPDLLHSVRRHKVMREIRLAVKPGITGLAQIRSSYDLRPEHIIKYDYLYIQRRSLLLNMKIMLQTIPVLFSKKGW